MCAHVHASVAHMCVRACARLSRACAWPAFRTTAHGTCVVACVGACVAVDTSIAPRDQLGKFYCDSLVHDADALKLVVKVFGKHS